MNLQRATLAHAVSCALASISFTSYAQVTDRSLAPVIVTADPFGAQEQATILSPARVLAGDALRDKLSGSLGETLMQEPGIHSSGFSTGSSRPIIRGLEGPRVKILQNGMGNGDLSAISNDHAVGLSTFSAQQIEILRGPATLLYGSGAIGGAVNIVNGRIPTRLEERPTGEAELRAGSVDNSSAFAFSADRAAGNIGLHIDGNLLRAGDYRIPGNSNAHVEDGPGDVGRLSFSGNRENNLGVGASLIQSWGYLGASISQIDKLYGIRGHHSSKIDLLQNRFDIDSLIRSPFAGFDSIRFKLGQTEYRHTELEDGTDPHIRFTNRALESRVELAHQAIAGWRGRFGLQTDGSTVQALDLHDAGDSTVPRTRSSSTAAFIVEETDIGDVRLNAGARLEQVGRRPVDAAQPQRNFTLGSASFGALWRFTPGYGLGSTVSLAQRAPTPEELYSAGPHHPTETYDKGTSSLGKETSQNIDLSLQKTEDRLRWKANVFQNKVNNFIYGQFGEEVCAKTGVAGTCDEDDPLIGEALRKRTFSQSKATLRGYEIDVSYNLHEHGWFGRAFADDSRGTLDNLGYLPLQPVMRVGTTLGYQDANWRSSISILSASAQNRLATSPVYKSEDDTPEKATRGYTRVDANISWRQRIGENELTWFASARNLLNEEIRLSTSLLRDYAPQPGRNFIVGVRARF